MASPSKRKGDRAELEAEKLLRLLLNVPARRALGAGRLDDIGDIHGVPNTVVQVANWKDVVAAVREKPIECELQRQQYEALIGREPFDPPVFGATFLRLRGGDFRVVQLPEQWAAMWREAA